MSQPRIGALGRAMVSVADATPAPLTAVLGVPN
jgi:hypothetical protein